MGTMKRSKNRQLSFLMTISSVMAGIMLSGQQAYAPVLETSAVASSGYIRVITRPSLHTYFESNSGPDGMEFQLIQAFAKEHQLQLEMILTENSDDIYSALDNGLADIALLGQPLSITRRDVYPKSTAYRDVSYQLLFNTGKGKPASLADIGSKTIVVKDNEQNRIQYRHLKAFYGNLEWQFTDEPVESLMTRLSKGEIDYTITDSLTFALKHPLFPNIDSAFDLQEPQPVSLLYSTAITPTLRQDLDAYIARSKSDGSLALLMERFYGHATDFDNNGYRSFSFLMRNRLPAYQASIKAVANEYRMDWRLLAAIAYQESHWDPEARSKTGVRGFMMLTHDTATEMGVEDRIDTLQSLRGGARYFNRILKDLPASIQEPDRTWMALAAYNVGSGHLMDAIDLTRRQSGNPDSWLDVKQRLPLLAQKEWHSQTRFGYARGNEPVDYVQNIRRYHDILAWRFPLQFHEKSAHKSDLIVKTLDEVIQAHGSSVVSIDEEDDSLRLSALFF